MPWWKLLGVQLEQWEVMLNRLKLHSKWRHSGSRQPTERLFLDLLSLGQWNVLFFPQVPWRLGRDCCLLLSYRWSRGGWERVKPLPPFKDTFIYTQGGGNLNGIFGFCSLHKLQGKYLSWCFMTSSLEGCKSNGRCLDWRHGLYMEQQVSWAEGIRMAVQLFTIAT